MEFRKATLTVLLIICLVLPVSSVFGTEEDSWTSLEPMPTARYNFGVAVVDGKIYAIGGGLINSSVSGINEMYDPATNTWTTKEPMPTARAGFGIAVYQNKIHVMGGYIPYQGTFSQAHEVYDPLTDAWEIKNGAEFPGFFCANVAGEKLYVIGGLIQYLPPPMTRTQVLVYDPINDTWTNSTPIPIGVADFSSAVVENKIYIIGGRSSSVEVENTPTQIYDTETETWSNGTRIPSMVFNAVGGSTSGEFASEKIYVFGGIDYSKYLDESLTNLYDPQATTNLTQIYDPETDMWTTGTPMPTSRYGLGVAIIDDCLYAIGGKKGGETYTTTYYNNNEKYTPIGYIPEFPSSTIVPLFLVASSLIFMIVKNELGKKE